MLNGKVIDKPWKLIVLIILEVVVFGLVYWLFAVRFFPANEAIRNAIVIIFILAVGMAIILYGNVTRNRNLNVLGFAIFLFAVFVIIDRYEGFAVKISAFAALAVAFTAFAAIDENRRMRLEKREQEQKDRLEKREQEQKDRKERMLNEIQDWATKVLRNMLLASRFSANMADFKGTITNCRSELLLSVAESIKVRAVCNSLSLNTQISASDADRIKKSMKLVDESMNDFVKMLLAIDINNVTVKTLGPLVEPLIAGAGSLTSKVRSLLAIVSEIAVA